MKNLIQKAPLVALAVLAAAMGAAQSPITVTVNGQAVQFDGGGPIQRQGRVLVPLRGVFEKMGASVDWNSYNREVTADQGSNHVQLRIGNRYATVNGNQVMMDVPAAIYHGSTMVPLRFVSEALGANVQWQDYNQTAAIMTNGYQGQQQNNGQYQGQASTTETHAMHSMLRVNSVIPVTLSSELSSNNSRIGDTFSTNVRTAGQDNYGGIPNGSRIEGHVIAARPRQGNEPGMLQLGFDRLILPDGNSMGLNGSLVGLDSTSVTKAYDGTLQAIPGKATSRNPIVYVGLGAGAGAVLAMITKGNILTDSVVGGALGFLVDSLQKGNGNSAKDVNLPSGTEFGVRLNQPLRQ